MSGGVNNVAEERGVYIKTNHPSGCVSVSELAAISVATVASRL